MNILAVDTSNEPLAIGIAKNGHIVGEWNTVISKKHSMRLMPAVQRAMEEVRMVPEDLDALAVAHGPGSYTGVRIGVTTAKTMAYALDRPIIGISSLQVLAQNGFHFDGDIVPMFAARQQLVYSGVYTSDSRSGVAISEQADALVSVDKLLRTLHERGRHVFVCGPGVDIHREIISREIGERVTFGDDLSNRPRGGHLVRLAFVYAEKNKHHAHDIQPQYLQVTEAEKKLMANRDGVCAP